MYVLRTFPPLLLPLLGRALLGLAPAPAPFGGRATPQQSGRSKCPYQKGTAKLDPSGKPKRVDDGKSRAKQLKLLQQDVLLSGFPNGASCSGHLARSLAAGALTNHSTFPGRKCLFPLCRPNTIHDPSGYYYERVQPLGGGGPQTELRLRSGCRPALRKLFHTTIIVARSLAYAGFRRRHATSQPAVLETPTRPGPKAT